MGFFDIVNIRGLIFVVLLALPHALYIRSSFYKKPVYENRAMVYISRIGRFFSFFLMSVNIGVLERGFTSALMESFWFWFCVAAVTVYLALWTVFLKKSNRLTASLLAAVMSLVVIVSGILQVKTLLMTAGIVLAIGEGYIIKSYFKR